MVAESVPAPVEEEVSTAEVGNAGEQSSANAASPPVTPEAPPDDAALEAEAQAALEALKKDRGKEGEGQKAPGPQRPAVDPALVQRARETLATNYRNRQAEYDGDKAPLLDMLVDAGIPRATAELAVDAFVKKGKDRFNSHHADALQYGAFEAVETEVENYRQGVWQAVGKTLPKNADAAFRAEAESLQKANGGNLTWDVVTQALWNTATAQRDLYYAWPSDALPKGGPGFQAIFTPVFRQGRGQAEKVASAASSGPTVNGNVGGPTATPEAEDAQLLDPHVPQQVKDAILVKRGML